MQYHRWADSAIAGPSSIEYYEAVKSFLSAVPDPRSRVKREKNGVTLEEATGIPR